MLRPSAAWFNDEDEAAGDLQNKAIKAKTDLYKCEPVPGRGVPYGRGAGRRTVSKVLPVDDTPRTPTGWKRWWW